MSDTTNHSHNGAASSHLARIGTRGLIVGILGLAACAVGAVVDSEQFFRSYLIGYIFVIMFVLGSFGLKMLHNMVAGAWGFAIRRFLEGAIRTLPLMAVLFIPILFGMHSIFEWTHEDVVAADHVLSHKVGYLNTTFFTIRAAIYFALWIGLGFWVNALNKRQEHTPPPSPPLTRKIQRVSAASLVLLVLTGTFASVDWMMSLEPHWFSTIYGVLFVIDAALSAVALMAILLATFRGYEPLASIMRPRIGHDIGNLMFAFTMLWAYISFSQYLIIWSGNLAEETPWYAVRTTGVWEYIAWVLILFHFIVPFLALLSRKNKRNLQKLAMIAVGMIAMRFVDLIWNVVPAFTRESFGLSWLDFAAPLGVGGIWLWYFTMQVKGRELLPVYDPRFQDALDRIAHADEAEAEAQTGRLHGGMTLTEDSKHG